MAKVITLADLTSDTTTLHMFGQEYTVLAITRSVQKKLEKAQPAMETITDEEDSDRVVETLADALDGMLLPEGDGKVSAKKAIVDAWESDALTLGQLSALFERVQEAAIARPT